MLEDEVSNSLPENEAQAKKLWQRADAVCFDVDSTLCVDEMIDEFAKYLHCSEVVKLTEETMNGKISFRESLRVRLNILKPTRKQLEYFIEKREPRLTPGGEALVAELHRLRIPVYLISGSFLPMVIPVAKVLKIPEANIYANEIFFDDSGFYIGFDETRLTSDSDSKNFGKSAVCRKLKDEKGYRNLVMIGDGVTDLEASLHADLFIGFGGNQCREVVESKALWYVYDFDTLRTSLADE
ncbi:L-3-phosphoserine phosphatase [Loa loa]|uniref:Phosphoserine phosphatase n=1 Tax=Loa loa TaxID=7209 RepID=A0A1I7VVD7_LOALO|nr:L-3-phosphoserine phosphatase [Loa loa]EFO27775.2 L-3-phosphoserine phosphatase [Loa loa]